jgi:hypothetical protein
MARVVATRFVRNLVQAGWMSEETLPDYRRILNIAPVAKPFLEVLARVDEGLSLEYESHVVAVYSRYSEIVKSWGVIFKHVADNARLYRTLFGSSGNAAFLRRIREHFASVVKERMEPRLEAGKPGAPRGMTKKPASDLPYALAANVMIGTIVWWLEEGQDYDLDEVILLTREIMHDGFRRLLRV